MGAHYMVFPGFNGRSHVSRAPVFLHQPSRCKAAFQGLSHGRYKNIAPTV